MKVLLRSLHGLMALLFFLSVTVQFNDPSPLPWIALYSAAALITGCAAAGRPSARWALGLIAVCAGWEIHYLRLAAWRTPFLDLTREWHMTDDNIVNGREFYALIWIAAWMLGLCLTRRWVRRPTADRAAAA